MGGGLQKYRIQKPGVRSQKKRKNKRKAVAAAYSGFRILTPDFCSYSYLSASIGSRRAAFHAGHKPKMIPTAAEMPMPTPMAHSGT